MDCAQRPGSLTRYKRQYRHYDIFVIMMTAAAIDTTQRTPRCTNVPDLYALQQRFPSPPINPVPWRDLDEQVQMFLRGHPTTF